jgi:hypothetical protein
LICSSQGVFMNGKGMERDNSFGGATGWATERKHTKIIGDCHPTCCWKWTKLWNNQPYTLPQPPGMEVTIWVSRNLNVCHPYGRDLC